MLHKYTFTEILHPISVFSLFSIVTFPNGGCASQDASRNGTCYTSEECLEKSGTVSGNCAAGYANLNIIIYLFSTCGEFVLPGKVNSLGYLLKRNIVKGVSSKSSGNLIVPQIFCFLSLRFQILAPAMSF